jgi:hypothetical protein
MVLLEILERLKTKDLKRLQKSTDTWVIFTIGKPIMFETTNEMNLANLKDNSKRIHNLESVAFKYMILDELEKREQL